jgi:hypothetical protein
MHYCSKSKIKGKVANAERGDAGKKKLILTKQDRAHGTHRCKQTFVPLLW